MGFRSASSLCGVAAAGLVGLGPAGPAAGEAGIVIETVRTNRAAEAGLLPGDVLLRWDRAAAPPANPEAATGLFRSPFDLDQVELEQAPRGEVTLSAARGGEVFAVTMPHGSWRLTTRPLLEGDHLAAYLQGQAAVGSDSEDEERQGIAAWRRLAARLEDADELDAASWLWSRIGRAELRLGEVEDGAASFQRAVEAAERLGDLRRVAHLKSALAFSWERRSRFEAAIRLHEESLVIRERLAPRSLAVAAILHQLGSLADDRDELSAADELYARALTLRRELAPDSLPVADTLNNIGILAWKRGDVATAGEHYRQALEIRDRLVPGSVYVSSSLQNLGNVASRVGDLDAAEAHYLRALGIQQRLAPDSLDVASAFNNLGVLDWRRGDLSAAEEDLRRGLAIAEKVAPDSLMVATNLSNLGVLAYSRRDFAGAESYHRRALAIRERLAPGSLDVAASWGNLGVVAADRGDLAAAEGFYRRALASQQELAPDSPHAAATFNNLGELAAQRGEYRVAEESFRRALAIRERQAPDGLEVAITLSNLGELAAGRGELVDAERHYRRALEIRRRLAPGGLDVSESLHKLAALAGERGEASVARDLLERSLEIRSVLAPGSAWEAETLAALGGLHRQEGRANDALEHLRRALAALEAQTGRLGGGSETRGSFLARYGDIYRETIDLLVAEGRSAEAFHVLERSRVRGLLALLAERDLLFGDLPDGVDRERRLADVEHDRALRELTQWTAAFEGGEEERDRRRRRLVEARLRQEEVRAAVRLASPRLAALEAPQPLTLAQAQEAIAPGTRLLAYSIGDRGSHLFVVGEDVFAALPLAIDRETLVRDVERFRRLWGPGERRESWIQGEAARLTAALLAPVATHIAAAERLVVLPDGPLHYLPFAALHQPGTGGTRFLVEAAPISVVASATLWNELRKGRRTTRLAVAAFADPLYPGDAPDEATEEPVLRSTLRDGLALPSLPGTRAEAAALAELYGADARLFVGAEAREETVKAVAHEASILHFATHGLVNDRQPLSSALALSIPVDWREGHDNGLLQAWEIFEQLRIDADLVTLSACETALGKDGGGEGLLGLTRAFQFAGARTVLASLWAVSDDSTALLMERFYRHLHAGESKDQALRKAQLELIAGPIAVGEGVARVERRFQHPFHWAAFQVIGDWR